MSDPTPSPTDTIDPSTITDLQPAGRTLRKRAVDHNITAPSSRASSLERAATKQQRICVSPLNTLPNGKKIKFTVSPDTDSSPDSADPPRRRAKSAQSAYVVADAVPKKAVKANKKKLNNTLDALDYGTTSDEDDSDASSPTISHNLYGGYVPPSHLPTPTAMSSADELISYQHIQRRNVNSYRKWASSRRAQVLLDRRDLFEPFLLEKKIHGKAKLAAHAQSQADAAERKAKLASTSTTPITSVKHVVHPYMLESPPYIIAQLRDYQVTGVNWIISHFDTGVGAILGDEMGLGKTIQSLTFLSYLKHVRHMNGPSIVICPLAVASNWINEIKKFCTDLTYIKFQGGIAERDILLDDMRLTTGAYDVVITTYETFIAELDFFQDPKIRWLNVIVDEAHRIKSATARLREGLTGMKTGFQLLLTGTPLQNNLHELWSLLDYLLPDARLDPKIFLRCFDLDKKEIHTDLIPKAAALLDSLMLRRTKAQVETSLPAKTLINVYVPLTKLQIKLYRRLLMRDAQLNDSLSYSQLMFVLVQLRKVCNHPSTLFIHRFNANDAKYKALYNHLQKNDTALEDLITHRRDIFNRYAPPVYKPVVPRRRNNQYTVDRNRDRDREVDQVNGGGSGSGSGSAEKMDVSSSQDNVEIVDSGLTRGDSNEQLDMHDAAVQQFMVANDSYSMQSHEVPTAQSNEATRAYNSVADAVRRQCRHSCGCRDTRTGEVGPPAVFYSNSWWKHEANQRIHPLCTPACQQFSFLQKNAGFEVKARSQKQQGDAHASMRNKFLQSLERAANKKIVDTQPSNNETAAMNSFYDTGPSQQPVVYAQSVSQPSPTPSQSTNISPNTSAKRNSTGRRQKSGFAELDDVNLPYTSHTVLDEGGRLVQLHACRHLCGCVNRMTGAPTTDGKPAAFTHRGSRYSHELRGTLHPHCSAGLECYKLIIKGELKDENLRDSLNNTMSTYQPPVQAHTHLHHQQPLTQAVDTQQLNAHMSYHEQLKAKIEQSRRTPATLATEVPAVKSEPLDTSMDRTSVEQPAAVKHEPTADALLDNADNQATLKQESALETTPIIEPEQTIAVTESAPVTATADNVDVLQDEEIVEEMLVDDGPAEVIEAYRAIALDTDLVVLVVMIEIDGTIATEIEPNRMQQHVEIDVNNISESDLDYRFMPIDQLIRASGKLTIMHKLLLRLHSEGSRVLIFTHFTSCLDVLERYVLEQQWQYKRMDGHTNRVIRELDIRDFNKHPEYFIYLISTKSGGQGINLASADVVILYDCDWNPQLDLQAEDRAHRIGQKKPVRVYRLVTENTVEERIVQRAMKKLALDSMVVGKGGTGQRNQLKAAAAAAQADVDNAAAADLLGANDPSVDGKQVSSREVFNMLKYGADTIFRSTGTDISDVDLDALLSRSKRHEVDKSAVAADPETDVDVELGGIQTIFMQDFKERLPDEDAQADETQKHDHNVLSNAVDNMLSNSDESSESEADNDVNPTCAQCGAVNELDGVDEVATEMTCINCSAVIPINRSESPNQSLDSVKQASKRTYDGVELDDVMDEAAETIDPLTGRRVRMRAARLKPVKQFEQEPIKKENNRPKMLHESDCFVCEDARPNLECSQCPKVYHTACLGMDGIPRGRWTCGWHHCLVCFKGKSLVGGVLFSCISCPTSYCFDDLPDSVRILRLKHDHQVIQKLKANHYKVNFDNLMFYQCDNCKHKYSKLVDVAQQERQQQEAAVKQRELYEETKRVNKQNIEQRKRKKYNDDAQKQESKRHRELEMMMQAEAFDIQTRYNNNLTEAQMHVVQRTKQLAANVTQYSSIAALPAKKPRMASTTFNDEIGSTDGVPPLVNIGPQRRVNMPHLQGIELPLPQRSDDKAQTIVPYLDTSNPAMQMQQYILPNSMIRCKHCHSTERPYMQFVVPSIKAISTAHMAPLIGMITKKQAKMLRTMRDSDLKQLRAHEAACPSAKPDSMATEMVEQSNMQYAAPLHTAQSYHQAAQQPMYMPYMQQYYPPPAAIPIGINQATMQPHQTGQRLQHPALTQFASMNLYPNGDDVLHLSQITQTHMSLVYEWFEQERQRVAAMQNEQYIMQHTVPDAARCDWSTVPKSLLSTQQRTNFYQQLFCALGGQPDLEYPFVKDTPVDLYVLWWHAIMEGLPSVWRVEQWQLFIDHIRLNIKDENMQALINDMSNMFFFYHLNTFAAPVQEQIQARQLADALRNAVARLDTPALAATFDERKFAFVAKIALLAGVEVMGADSMEQIRVHPYLGARLAQYDVDTVRTQWTELQKALKETSSSSISKPAEPTVALATIASKPKTVFSARVVNSGTPSINSSDTRGDLLSPQSVKSTIKQ